MIEIRNLRSFNERSGLCRRFRARQENYRQGGRDMDEKRGDRPTVRELATRMSGMDWGSVGNAPTPERAIHAPPASSAVAARGARRLLARAASAHRRSQSLPERNRERVTPSIDVRPSLPGTTRSSVYAETAACAGQHSRFALPLPLTEAIRPFRSLRHIGQRIFEERAKCAEPCAEPCVESCVESCVGRRPPAVPELARALQPMCRSWRRAMSLANVRIADRPSARCAPFGRSDTEMTHVCRFVSALEYRNRGLKEFPGDREGTPADRFVRHGFEFVEMT